MKVTTSEPSWPQRCPYLGLHDDESTALAYASAWNYCYHANPPASILVSHQAEVCLCPQYVDCAVNLANEWGPMPRSLRGDARGSILKKESSRKFTRTILAVLLAAIVILIILWSQGFLF
ncbi:MAG TPA: hypothetical protein VK249_19075 [Anaerolineales bacterium]|nr:hypothetical protein [Anaerolineales bacterium]